MILDKIVNILLSLIISLSIYTFCNRTLQKKYNTALIIFIIFAQDILNNELFRRIIENDYTIFILIFTESSLFLVIYFMYYGDLLKKVTIYVIVYLTNKFLSSITIIILCLIPDSF